MDIGDRSAYDVWRILDQVNDAYFNSNIQIPYDMFFNSNSYVNTLLKVVGIGTSAYLDAVTPDDVISPSLDPFLFPGVGADALASMATAIDLDLTGYGNIDIIRTGYGDDTLSGAAGNDTLDGGVAVTKSPAAATTTTCRAARVMTRSVRGFPRGPRGTISP